MTGAVSFGLNGFSWVANGASWVGSLFSSKKKSGKSPKRPFDDFSTPGRPTGCGHRLWGLSFARWAHLPCSPASLPDEECIASVQLS